MLTFLVDTEPWCHEVRVRVRACACAR
jgi:hypothetical protein